MVQLPSGILLLYIFLFVLTTGSLFLLFEERLEKKCLCPIQNRSTNIDLSCQDANDNDDKNFPKGKREDFKYPVSSAELDALCQETNKVTNDEVWNSKEDIGSPKVNHIYIKTHKTGSTSVGSIFFRFGARRGLRFVFPSYQGHFLLIGSDISPGNLTIHHLDENWDGKVEESLSWLKTKVPLGSFVTIMREPISRLLSAYDFFVAPSYQYSKRKTMMSLKDALSSRKLRTVTEDIGIRNEEDLDWFLTEAMKQFSIILILEKIDESLLLMKRLFDWNLEDILYVKMFESCRDRVRYDGRGVICRENITDNGITLDMIEAAKTVPILQLEMKLYNESLKRLNLMLSKQKEDFWEELEIYRKKLQKLNEKCKTFVRNLSKENEEFVANPDQFGGAYPCFPYILSDMQYERKVFEGEGTVFDLPGLYNG